MAMSEEMRVVAAIVQRDGKFLVCQRPKMKRHGGLWEFPGGKLLAGESLSDAARRELAEELGVNLLAIGDVRLTVPDVGSPYVIQFVDAEIEGDPTPREHEAVGWHTARELSAMPLAPSDAELARLLLAGQPVEGRGQTARQGRAEGRG